MSDTNAFINAYIDNSVGMIHENTVTILQLKTQLKVANDSLSQKDIVISNLTNEIEQLKNISDEATQAQLSQMRAMIEERDAKIEELKNINSEGVRIQQELQASVESNRALHNKVSHLDAAIAQVGQMKSMIQERDAKIEELNRVIENLKIPPKSSEALLNNKGKKTIQTSKKVEVDDF